MQGTFESRHTNAFISSPVKGLLPFRRAAIDAVFRCNLFPVAMEQDAAVPSSPEDYSLELADSAQVYILILGHRYGHFTINVEYPRATALNIPILVFIPANNIPFNADDIDEDPILSQKLVTFIENLKKKFIVSTYDSPLNLAFNIVVSIYLLRERNLLPETSSNDDQWVYEEYCEVFLTADFLRGEYVARILGANVIVDRDRIRSALVARLAEVGWREIGRDEITDPTIAMKPGLATTYFIRARVNKDK